MKKKINRFRGKPPRRMPKDFHWRLLQTVLTDLCEGSPSMEGYADDLSGIIRNRDIQSYIAWCKNHDLSTEYVPLRDHCIPRSLDCHLLDIRKIRLLSFLKKFDFPDSPFDKEAAALKNFKRAEAKCQTVNADPIWQLFDRTEIPDNEHRLDEVFLFPVLREAKDFIRRVLGPLDIELIFNQSYHGPGATSDKSGDDSIPIEKFLPPYGVTSGARELFCQCILTDRRWFRSLVQLTKTSLQTDASLLELGITPHDIVNSCVETVESSRQLFVPKDSEKLRGISAEPTGNIFLQLGVGKYLAKRLKKFGFDISTQEKNQLLAKLGSVNDELSTIDLSMASDSIAAVLLLLFPREWATLLMRLRTPSGIFKNGETVVYEKLSAMGNGFTFGIETLIFASLIVGLCEYLSFSYTDVIENIAVYGDDIIIPRHMTRDYLYVLKRCGFTPNKDKTFIEGPIRESCGHDYYQGELISRPTIKKPIESLWELHRTHNLLYLWANAFKIPLTGTLAFIRRYAVDVNYGPPSEDVVAWFFSATPSTLPSVKHEDAIKWQVPVYRLKRLRVTHPKPDRCKIEYGKIHALLFLSRSDSHAPNWSELFFPASKSYINDTVERDPFGFVTRQNWDDSGFAFIKMRTRTLQTVVSLPYYLWRSDATNNLDNCWV